jgi:hypothetical protein
MNDTRVITPSPSESTLARLPARVLVFLTAIATRPPIRAAMYEAGFRPADHAEGWRLLTATAELRDNGTALRTHVEARQAMTELNQWAATNFRRYRVALERLHPTDATLFPEVDSRYPADCLLAMAQLLEQLRKYAKRRDKSVLTTLGRRGLDAAELERLARLVKKAQCIAPTSHEEPDEEPRTDERIELYHWYRDWAESAKRFVKRKDYRRVMGVGGTVVYSQLLAT